MTRLATILSILIALTVCNVSAATIDPTDGIISDTHLGQEDDVWIATIDVLNRETLQYDRIHVSMLNEYATLPVDGHSDVYTQTEELIVFSQNDTTYTAFIYVPVKYPVMLAIVGQEGDASFDNAWYDLANDCTILAVIDNVNDSISPNIYTRLSCYMTQDQIDNAGERLGDSLLLITPMYTVNVPIVTN